MIARTLFLATLFLTAHAVKADSSFVLITTNFVITVIDRTPEYVLGCTNVTYVGVSRKTGNTLKLTGSTNYSTAQAGSSGHFRGYMFKNGGYIYTLNNEFGWLLHISDPKGKTVVLEPAIAQYD